MWITCKWCGKKFENGTGVGLYCSRKCANEANAAGGDVAEGCAHKIVFWIIVIGIIGAIIGSL